jgi:hypothetical protein
MDEKFESHVRGIGDVGVWDIPIKSLTGDVYSFTPSVHHFNLSITLMGVYFV